MRERRGKAARVVKREAKPPLRVGWQWTGRFGRKQPRLWASGLLVSAQVLGAGPGWGGGTGENGGGTPGT